MEIAYETAELRDLFRFPARALDRYGPTTARALAVRFADLAAAPNAGELDAFSPEYAEFDGIPSLKMPLTPDHGLRIIPNHPKREDRPVNWANVTRIKIIAIVRNR